ncbi:MAG: HD domain-containing protein [Candidatus Aenigmarchaeota archaeon]|nr:HD domain-containing protein [Candidatus Aenigmarchaeota archaeon]
MNVLRRTNEYVKSVLTNESSGHGWWHTSRVRNIALLICEKENADKLVVELASLLHDISDWKFNDGDHKSSSEIAAKFLRKLEIEEDVISHICDIIDNVTFRGSGVETAAMNTTEGKIVQDADRLDAMGATGIARAFAYGGHAGREIYNPDIKPEMHSTFEEYKKNKSPSLNHFYEKLLLLKDRMNTETGKEIAEERHKFMEEYIKRFLSEWEGKK